MKKFFAILLSAVLMLSLTVPAMAAGEDENTSANPTTYSITINNELPGHTYVAYQIFAGDLKVDGTDDEANKQTTSILSNIVWGNGITEEGKTALYAKYGLTKDADKTAAKVAEALAGGTAADAADFAKTAGRYLATSSGTFSSDGGYKISGLEAGYYLIMDDAAALPGYDVKTSYIIEVVENSTVNPKSEKPEVDKQVHDETADAEEGNTNGWGETADHAINESFQFKLIATLPEDADFAAYDTYKIVFTDKMSAGISFESIASVKVNGTDVPVKSDAKPYGYYLSTNAVNNAPGITWTLTIDDIKKYDADLTNGAIVEVIYNAHLNENAVIGNNDGNNNTVGLEYSNNPNVEGGNELGRTPEDTVWVFTYVVNGTKVDGRDKTTPLPGAEFVLYRKVVDENDAEALEYVTLDNNNKVTGWTTTKPVPGNIVTIEDGIIKITGLDHGTYYLEETKAPEGYNLLDAPYEVKIEAEHDESENTTTATTQFTVNGVEENPEITVENNAGSTLPETGGIGTTIFYAVGGVMVAAAAILLITKKRMSAEG